jgi:hypothetical protein
VEQDAREGHRDDQDAQAPGDRLQGAGTDGEAEEQAAQGLDDRVTGWLSATPWSHVGMVATGTKALLG